MSLIEILKKGSLNASSFKSVPAHVPAHSGTDSGSSDQPAPGFSADVSDTPKRKLALVGVYGGSLRHRLRSAKRPFLGMSSSSCPGSSSAAPVDVDQDFEFPVIKEGSVRAQSDSPLKPPVEPAPVSQSSPVEKAGGSGDEVVFVPPWNLKASAYVETPTQAHEFLSCFIPHVDSFNLRSLDRDNLIGDLGTLMYRALALGVAGRQTLIDDGYALQSLKAEVSRLEALDEQNRVKVQRLRQQVLIAQEESLGIPGLREELKKVQNENVRLNEELSRIRVERNKYEAELHLVGEEKERLRCELDANRVHKYRLLGEKDKLIEELREKCDRQEQAYVQSQADRAWMVSEGFKLVFGRARSLMTVV